MITFNAQTGDIQFSGTAILDKGATFNTISRAALNDKRLTTLIEPNRSSVVGINGPVDILGRLTVNKLTIGQKLPITFDNIQFDVIDSDEYIILIGQSILRDNQEKVEYNYKENTVTFTSKGGDLLKTDLCDKSENSIQVRTVCTAMNTTDVEPDNVRWATEQLKVTFGDKAETTHKQQMADLIFEFKDVRRRRSLRTIRKFLVDDTDKR